MPTSNDIQIQIDVAASNGGGDVIVPVGVWPMTSQIVLKSGVRLIGQGMTAYNYALPGPVQGSVLDIRWGSGAGSSGDINRAAIVMEGGTSVENICFTYPQDRNASAPVEWGSTLQCHRNGNLHLNDYRMRIKDNYFFKSYMAVDFRNSLGTSNVTIEGNQGAPIYSFLGIDGITDWVVCRDNNMNSGMMGGDPKTGLPAWSNNNGAAYLFGGNDWLQSLGNQTFGYYVGARVTGAQNYAGQGPYLFDNCQFDGCFHGIELGGELAQCVSIIGSTFCPYNFATGQPGAGVGNLPGVNMTGGFKYQNNTQFGPSWFGVYLGYGQVRDALIQGNIIRCDGGSPGSGITLIGVNPGQVFNNSIRGFAAPIHIQNSNISQGNNFS